MQHSVGGFFLPSLCSFQLGKETRGKKTQAAKTQGSCSSLGSAVGPWGMQGRARCWLRAGLRRAAGVLERSCVRNNKHLSSDSHLTISKWKGIYGMGTSSEGPKGEAASRGERTGGAGGWEVSAKGAASPKKDGEGGERMRMKRNCCPFAASVLGPALPHFLPTQHRSCGCWSWRRRGFLCSSSWE